MNCSSDNYISSSFYNNSNGMRNNQRNISSIYKKQDWDLKYLDSKFSYKEIFTEYFYCNICCNSNSNKIKAYNGGEYFFNNTLKINEFAEELLNLIGSMSIGKTEIESLNEDLKLEN